MKTERDGSFFQMCGYQHKVTKNMKTGKNYTVKGTKEISRNTP